MGNDASASIESHMVFDSRHVSFGRAQTFPLRLGWLPKLYAFLTEHDHTQAPTKSQAKKAMAQSNRFSDEDMMSELGVGKNMITSIKHWARAADVIGDNANLTDFGRRIFAVDGFDPYLEDEVTLWLLHWKIASRSRFFTAGYFLFNYCFRSDDFTAEQLLDDVTEHLKRANVTYSRASVKNDVVAALHMYAMRNSKHDGDESLESPFPLLGLIRAAELSSRYTFALESRETLPPVVVGYAATELMQAKSDNVLQLEFVGGHGSYAGIASLANVFRITEEALLQKLHKFCEQFPAVVLQDVAGSWQLFLNGKLPSDTQLLKAIYAPPIVEGSARRKKQPVAQTLALSDSAAGVYAV